MARFVWVDNEEVYNKHVGVKPNQFDHEDEGFVYDTHEKVKIMDFGNFTSYYNTAGDAPNQQFLDIIMNALNTHDFTVAESK